jgi:hypothetical protein
VSKGEQQVKTANNCFGNAKSSETITYYVDAPDAKPAKIVPQHIHCVPACGTNNLLSITKLRRTGVNFELKLD